jgi:hypothetical protein
MPNRDDLDPQERRKRTMRPAMSREQVQQIEVSKLAGAMRYREKDFEQDWELAQAIALLMAVSGRDDLAVVLEQTMNRIIAYGHVESHKVWAIMSGRVDLEVIEEEWA